MQTHQPTFQEVFSQFPPSIVERLQHIIDSSYSKLMDKDAIKAIVEIIDYFLKSGKSEKEIIRLIFQPINPDEDRINLYRENHERMYKEQAIEFTQKILNSNGQVHTITSGMFGGKSTLANEITNTMELEPDNYRVIHMVPHFMGNHITLRGRGLKAGETVGNDGFATIKAEQFVPGKYLELFESLNIDKDSNTVIHFDEFSFLPEGVVTEFINFIQQNYPKVKLILVGLNTNVFGNELVGYKEAKNFASENFNCKSFVPNESGDEYLYPPTGTMSTRYIKFPDGTMLLDTGFFNVVVPKEFEVVHYIPINGEDHMHTLLENMGRADLQPRNVDVSPEDKTNPRNIFLLKLDLGFKAKEA